jgi:NitT/TauT family transport system substrate-binding protein
MGRLNPTMDAQTFKDSAEAQKPLIETAETRTLGIGAMTNARWQALIHQLTDLKVIATPVDPQASFVETPG